MRAAESAWQLIQMVWVAALWLAHFVLPPLLERFGLAPLLVADLNAMLGPLLIGLAAVGAVLQILVLVQLQDLPSLWRDSRGQLLLLALLAAGLYGVLGVSPQALRLQTFCFLVVAVCGLALVAKPSPNGSFRAREARH